MSPTETGNSATRIAPKRAGDGDPAFDEPWQAQVLGVAFSLAERGVFSRTQWSDALGAALERAATAGAPDTQQTYYAAALEALEGLLARSGEVSPQSLTQRTEAWRRAYEATPHGKPVELGAGEQD